MRPPHNHQLSPPPTPWPFGGSVWNTHECRAEYWPGKCHVNFTCNWSTRCLRLFGLVGLIDSSGYIGLFKDGSDGQKKTQIRLTENFIHSPPMPAHDPGSWIGTALRWILRKKFKFLVQILSSWIVYPFVIWLQSCCKIFSIRPLCPHEAQM